MLSLLGITLLCPMTHPLSVMRIQHNKACTLDDVHNGTIVTSKDLHIELMSSRVVHDGDEVVVGVTTDKQKREFRRS